MVLELHVWGPAFGLPSIDPACLAAVAYLSRVLGTREEEWVLVAGWEGEGSGSGSESGMIGELPALRDGATVVTGYQNIVDHLRPISKGRRDLDASLNAMQKADATAFSSLLSSEGQSLIDLSLYLSAGNYHAATRPAYTHLLPFPRSWIIPTQRRTAAKLRTQHLNLAHLDLDLDLDLDPNPNSTTNDPPPARPHSDPFLPSSLARALNMKKSPPLTSALQHARSASLFRLSALSATLFDPLTALLNSKPAFFHTPSATSSSLDCLALGYLALALRPTLPHPWLAHTLRQNYPGLSAYTDNGIVECFGGPVDVQTALRPESAAVAVDDGAVLRWRGAEPESLLSTAVFVAETVVAGMPIVGPVVGGRGLFGAVGGKGEAGEGWEFGPAAVVVGVGAVVVGVVALRGR